jgi:hypothetical protein
MTTTVEDIGAAVLARVKTANVATATDLGGGSTSDTKVPSQKAVKTYVDAVATGTLADWKEAVAYGTTANITLSGLGTGTGRDWASSIAADSRVVVLKQTNGAENGIYLAKSGSWVRASDADQADEISQGTAVLITNGNEPTAGGLKGTTWFCTTTGSWTPGSTSTTWVQTTAAAVIAAGSLTATQMASTFLDTSTDLDGASASNTKVPTQKAVRTFVLAYAEPVTGIRSAEGLIAEQGGTLDFTGATDMTTLVTNAVNALNPGDVLQFPRGVIRLDGSGATGYGVDPTSRGVTLRGTHGATENNNPANDGIGTILRAGAAQLAVVRLGEDVSAYGGKGIEKLRIDQNSLATVGVLTESHDVTIDDISTHRPPAGGVGMYFYDDGNDANGDGHRSNIGKIICRGAYAVAGARPAGPWGASGTYDSQGLVLRDVNDYDFYSTVRVDHFIDGVVVDGAGGIGFGALHTSLGGPSAYASKAGVRFRRGAHHCWYVTPYLDNVRGGSQVVFEDGSTYYGIQFVAPHFLNGGWNVAEGGTGPGHAGLYPAVDIQLSTGSLRGVTFINPVLMAETAGHYFTAAVRAVTQASVRGLQWLYPVHRYCTTDFVLSGGGAFYPDVIGDGLVFTEGQASAGANTNDSPRSVGQTLRVISTNNTNLQGYDRYVKVTGTVTNINLPPIGGNATGTSSQHRYPGIITIRNAVTSGSITVSGRTGGTDDTIDGAATVTLANGATASFVPDGANWVQM